MCSTTSDAWIIDQHVVTPLIHGSSVSEGTLKERAVVMPMFLAELSKQNCGIMDYEGRYRIAKSLSPVVDQGLPPSVFGLKDIRLTEAVRSLNSAHSGRIMFLKTVLPAFKDVCTVALVEDLDGSVVVLNLYNYLASQEDPQQVFPAGAFLAVLEPILLLTDPNDAHSVRMRCDNPQYVLMFSSEKEWLAAKSEDYTQGDQMEVCYDDINRDGFSDVVVESFNQSEVLCEQGNAYFKHGKLKLALREYTRGLQLHPTGTRLLSNRALVYMRMECWPEALDDLERALIIDREHLKVRFRHCTVLLYLQRAKETEELLQKLIYDMEDWRRPKTEITGAKALMRQVKRALQEQKGKFDFKELREEANCAPGQVRKTVSRAHMDYKHPHIEVRPTENKGRGLFAAKYTRHSTLLMAEKALVFLPGPQPGHVQDPPMPMDRLQYHSIVRGNLLPKIVQKLVRHPEIGAGLYFLSDGERHTEPKSAAEDPTLVDLPRIRNILKVNHISPNNDQFSKFLSSDVFDDAEDERNEVVDLNEESAYGAGLWVNPSLFNHSCAPNCAFFVVGDFYFAAATRDISVGEELTVPYCSGHLNYTERQLELSTRLDWGFQCQCERCAYVQQHPEHAALEQEVEDYISAGLAEGSTYSVEHREELIARLQDLPPLHRGSLIPLLHLHAVSVSARTHDEDAALQLCWQQLALVDAIFGLPFNSSTYVRCFLRAVSGAIHMGEFIQAERFISRLFKVFVEVAWAQLDRASFLHLWRRDCKAQTLPLVEVIVDNVARGRSMCSHAGAAFAVSEVADRMREMYGYGSTAALESKEEPTGQMLV